MANDGMENQQLEFDFVTSAKARERLLVDVEFGERRNRMLMAGLLREIAKYGGGQCYVSQETFAKMFKCSRRTILRALSDLQELDVIAVQLRSRRFGDGSSRTINHYVVNWTTLAHLVSRQAATKTPPTDVTLTPTDVTVCTDRCDSSHRPMRQLAPTDVTPSCHTIEENLKQTTTTSHSGSSAAALPAVGHVVVEELPATTTNHAEQTPADCSDLFVVVVSLGVARAEDALRRARSNGFDRTAIEQRIEHFRALPEGKRSPGVLYNWLAKPGSFDREHAIEPPTLELAIGLDGPAERKRAELISYGRKEGWTHTQLQNAVRKFEAIQKQANQVGSIHP